MTINQPLSEAEYDELENFLMSDRTGDDSMDICMLDGFLTALAIAPNTVPPSRWLPRVWGKAEFVWDTQAQAERIILLIMRHMNFVASVFNTDPENFDPMISFNTFKGKEVPVIDEWCMGFVEGMMLEIDAWKPLLDSEEHEPLLLPLMLYGTETGWDQLKQNTELAERHERFVRALPRCILAIHQFWLPYRNASPTARTFRHATSPVGRNDLCACGSGKKFKKCCGDPAKVH